jgi:hypothetical protein
VPFTGEECRFDPFVFREKSFSIEDIEMVYNEADEI